ncbi:MAG: ABC transporter ATP-binding protein [Woeseiaceae bacterium]|nr:ABC transporter ATP-binding protein [Woeseiaceae bacterium]
MPDDSQAALVCRDLTVAVPGRCLVRSLELALAPGTFLAILGQNGAGKSLSLHTLAGLRPPSAGHVGLFGADLESLSRREIARQLALLPQHADDAFPATVFDTALAGRHPHVPRWQWESAADRRIALDCLARMDLQALLDRDVGTLSGGERRRVAIAQVLAQSTPVCLLDEPTNHLDPQHQLDVLDVFAARARAGATVVASLHDVNLAARYADECLLLFGDGRWLRGDTASVLNAAALSDLYATPMEAVAWRDRWLFVAAPTARH